LIVLSATVSRNSLLSTTSVLFFNYTTPTELYTLSLHDALPISLRHQQAARELRGPADAAIGELRRRARGFPQRISGLRARLALADRKSTRLNSSHGSISYAVFCLKKKKYITKENI